MTVGAYQSTRHWGDLIAFFGIGAAAWWLRRLAFPLAFLMLAVPMPYVIYYGLTQPVWYEQFEHRPQFLDSAQVYLNRALQTESRETLAESLVRLWFLKGEYGSVTGLAEGIAAGLIDDPWTLYRIGESYGKAGNVQKSIEYFEQAVSLAPDHLQFRTRLATTYTADRQLERAVQMFDSILSDHPKWAEAYNNRGFAFALLGDFERAEADFEQSISLDPDFEQALGNLASLYANTSRSEEARKYLERLMKIDPDNANYRRLYEVL